MDDVKRLMWWCYGGIAVLAAIVAVVAWFAWPAPQAQPRAREFRDYDMCLLTDSAGVSQSPASEAWRALQQISETTAVRASYVQVSGEQTPQRAAQFVTTLVQQRCAIIVSAGENQVKAAAVEAPKHPQITFIEAGSTVDVEALKARILPLIPAK